MMTSSSETTLVAAIRELAMELRLLCENLSFSRSRCAASPAHAHCERSLTAVSGFPLPSSEAVPEAEIPEFPKGPQCTSAHDDVGRKANVFLSIDDLIVSELEHLR